ncbi:energy transducer TonB [Pseudoduganella sp.]|uniref:energy transducer TonB n=1 Tax=Pseudoduganella sp. TaxID=1880898 RepID=UPI0035B1F91C
MNYETPRKNYTGIAFVTIAHLLAAFIAVKNSTITFTRAVPPDITVTPVPEKLDLPQPKPETEFEPTFRDPPISVPKPIIETIPDQPTITARRIIDDDGVTSGNAGSGTGSGTGSGGGGVAQHEPVRVAPIIDANNCAKPAYPAAALRNEETGTVSLAFLVGKDGKVASAKVERSSGSRDLDRAALNGLSLCRFTPGTVDGVPYESWFRMQYVWNLD